MGRSPWLSVPPILLRNAGADETDQAARLRGRDEPVIMGDHVKMGRNRSKSMANDRRIGLPALPKIAGVLGCVLVMAALGAGTARAQYQRAPWCAYLGSWGGSYDCSYYTFQQCMATASGLGNICLRNPRYVGDPERPRRPRR
jgi:hypothetical protein